MYNPNIGEWLNALEHVECQKVCTLKFSKPDPCITSLVLMKGPGALAHNESILMFLGHGAFANTESSPSLGLIDLALCKIGL